MKKPFKAPEFIKVIRGFVSKTSVSSKPVETDTTVPISSSWAYEYSEFVNQLLIYNIRLQKKLLLLISQLAEVDIEPEDYGIEDVELEDFDYDIELTRLGMMLDELEDDTSYDEDRYEIEDQE